MGNAEEFSNEGGRKKMRKVANATAGQNMIGKKKRACK